MFTVFNKALANSELQGDIDLKAPIASPTFTGTVGGPIPTSVQTQLNNKPYVVAIVSDLANVPSTYVTAIVKDAKRGGYFNWSSTGSANAGTVFAGLTGYWIRQYSEEVNVLWFGAVADGATDDSAAVQAATNTGNAVFFPAGTYKVSNISYTGKVVWFSYGGVTLLSDSIVIEVTNGTDSNISNFTFMNITAPWIITRNPDAWEATVTPVQSNGDGYQPTENDTDIWSSLTTAQKTQSIDNGIHFIGSASNINISKIQGNFTSISLEDAQYSTVRDCNIRAAKGDIGGITFWNVNGFIGQYNRAINNHVRYPSYNGIHMIANYDGLIEGNTVEYAGESGIKTGQNGISHCYRLKICNNATKYSFYDGIDVSTDWPHAGLIDTHHQIICNSAYKNRMTGFVGDGNYNEFVGNRAYSCSNTGMLLNYNHSQIHSNYIFDCNKANSPYYHQMAVWYENNSICGNYIEQVVANGHGIHAIGDNYISQNFCKNSIIYTYNENNFINTGTVIGNYELSGTNVIKNRSQLLIFQNATSVPAIKLYNETDSFNNIDIQFHPRVQVLANPIAQLRGRLTYGVSGSEAGVVECYAAQGGTLRKGWEILTDSAVAGAAWLVSSAPTTITPTSYMDNGTVSMYLDESGNNLKFAVKYSNGTIKSGTLALV